MASKCLPSLARLSLDGLAAIGAPIVPEPSPPRIAEDRRLLDDIDHTMLRIAELWAPIVPEPPPPHIAEYRRLLEEIEHTKLRIDALSEEVEPGAVKERVEKIARVVDAWKDLLDEARAKHSTATKQLESLRKEVGRLRKKKNATAEEMEAAMAELKDGEERVRLSKWDVNQSQGYVEKHSTELKQVVDGLEQKEVELREAEKRLRQLNLEDTDESRAASRPAKPTRSLVDSRLALAKAKADLELANERGRATQASLADGQAALERLEQVRLALRNPGAVMKLHEKMEEFRKMHAQGFEPRYHVKSDNALLPSRPTEEALAAAIATLKILWAFVEAEAAYAAATAEIAEARESVRKLQEEVDDHPGKTAFARVSSGSAHAPDPSKFRDRPRRRPWLVVGRGAGREKVNFV